MLGLSVVFGWLESALEDPVEISELEDPLNCVFSGLKMVNVEQVGRVERDSTVKAREGHLLHPSIFNTHLSRIVCGRG